MTKVAVIFTNYGPYHIARVQRFYQKCNHLEWNFLAIELTESGVAYDWKVDKSEAFFPISSVLACKDISEVTGIELAFKLLKILAQFAPDVVAIAGYVRPSMLIALAWCKLCGKRTVLFSESKADDAERNRVQEFLKKLIVSKFDAALVGGEQHKQYLITLGLSSESIFKGYNVVGNDVFHPSNLQNLEPPIRRPYFLAINRFIPKKNILRLIDAYASYRSQISYHAWDLILCGDGVLRFQIEQKIQEFNLQDHVHLPGFLQQAELLSYLAHASCFIHASIQEQWGLVVNEAMAASLPVLVSNQCGCFDELVLEGVNGFGFNPHNIEELTSLMLRISSPDTDLLNMKQASLEHIQAFSPNHFADGLMRATKYAISAS